MYSSNCSSSILGDHDGFIMGSVPLVKIIGELRWYGLRVTWVIVPPIVSVEGDDVNKLCLERGGRKKKERSRKEGRRGEREERKERKKRKGQGRGGREDKWEGRENRMAYQIHKVLRSQL